MKNLCIALVLIIFSMPVVAQPLSVMSYNIRYNNPGDSLNAWPYRKDHVASHILFYDVDYVGVQEALHDQMEDLQQRLPGYQPIGGGRDDGKTKGEYSAIFYNTKRLNALQSGMFWLSKTPDVAGSKGWDAALPRMVTWAKFQVKKTGKVFFAFNTHFDHQGQEARRESAKLLLKKVNEIAGKTPALVTGDFNSFPHSEPIKIITDEADPLRLTDSKSVSAHPHYGPHGTFNDFKTTEPNDQPIDYIFLKGRWKVNRHATLSQAWKGRYGSDHFSVFAQLLL